MGTKEVVGHQAYHMESHGLIPRGCGYNHSVVIVPLKQKKEKRLKYVS